MGHLKHSGVAGQPPCANSSNKRNSAFLPKQDGYGFPAPNQIPQQCGWFHLEATAPTACQVGEQKGQAEVRHSQATEII